MGERRWVHAEHLAEIDALPAHPLPVLRRRLAHSGPQTATDLARRYGLEAETVTAALRSLGDDVACGRFTTEAGRAGGDAGRGRAGAEQWIDRRALEQMHRRTLTLLRREVRPVPLPAYAEFLRRWQGVGPPEGAGVAGAAPGLPGARQGRRSTGCCSSYGGWPPRG